nr:apoptosis-associated speck-like protein containing a CARD [Paramormyrops kingsleyae]
MTDLCEKSPQQTEDQRIRLLQEVIYWLHQLEVREDPGLLDLASRSGTRLQETQTSLPNLLLEYLKELDDDELKEFKWKLSHTKYKVLKPLPRGQVKHLDRIDLADRMISYYMEADALEVTLEILKNMNLNDLDERLNEDLQKCNRVGNGLGDILEKTSRIGTRSP